MKVQINSNDNGSGTNTVLTLMADYNPQNKVFNKMLCKIEEDDFVGLFPENKQEKVFEQMQQGKIVFDVPKDKLLDSAKQIF